MLHKVRTHLEVFNSRASVKLMRWNSLMHYSLSTEMYSWVIRASGPQTKLIIAKSGELADFHVTGMQVFQIVLFWADNSISHWTTILYTCKAYYLLIRINLSPILLHFEVNQPLFRVIVWHYYGLTLVLCLKNQW